LSKRTPDPVRDALKRELAARGWLAGRDSAGSQGELYLWGDGDSAAALFEFKPTAQAACESMYQGSWLATLPPRFAVLPVSEKDAAEVDFLWQAGLSVLFYEKAEPGVVFTDLKSALALIARKSRRRV
jgi:hypothetical protein